MNLTCYLKKRDVRRFTYKTFLFSQNRIYHRIICTETLHSSQCVCCCSKIMSFFLTVLGATVKM